MEEQDILKRLVVAEEDVKKNLERIVTKAQKFFQIEAGTGRIIFSNVAGLSHSQRIVLLLAGRYFAKRLSLVDSEFMPLKDIGVQLQTPVTSLSNPIGRLVSDGVLIKRGAGEYAIVYYKIEKSIDDILDSKGSKR